jgi:hypothetical protein
MAHPLYMWSIRRYAAFVVPFLAALAAEPLSAWMGAARFKRTAATAVLIGAAALLLHGAWPVLRVTEYAGLPGFVRRLAGRMANADLVVCDHGRYATPLRYAFGLPAYQVSRQNEEGGLAEAGRVTALMRKAVGEGKRVYYVCTRGAFFDPGFCLEPVGMERGSSVRLARTRHRLPRTTRRDTERAGVYRVRAADGLAHDPVPVKLDIGYHSFGLAAGFDRMRKGKAESYRWTDGRGVLYVPCFAPAAATRYRLRLAAKRPRDWPKPVHAHVRVAGRFLGAFLVEREWREYEVTAPADMQATGTVELVLRSSTWDPAEHGIYGYPRRLGVRVDWIEVEPVE